MSPINRWIPRAVVPGGRPYGRREPSEVSSFRCDKGDIRGTVNPVKDGTPRATRDLLVGSFSLRFFDACVFQDLR